MAKFLIQIQSASDIITNSSSEVFLCQNTTDMSINELVKFIYDFQDKHTIKDWDEYEKMTPEEQSMFEHGGGMGGFFEITTYEESKGCWQEYEFKHLDNPENYILVDTDWNHHITIDWLIKNLNAKRID